MSVISSSGSSYVQGAPGPTPVQNFNKFADAGYTLINGTQNMLQLLSPNDGHQHGFQIIGFILVTVTEVGGQLVISWTLAGQGQAIQIDPGGRGVGQFATPFTAPCDPNTVVTVKQNSALTSRAAIWYGSIGIVI